MAVPWDVINSGLVLDDELADPRRLAEVRTAYDPHLVLGLEQDATAEAVRTAFRSLARQHHPDRGGDVAHFQRIQAAHDALVGVGSDAGCVLPFGCAQCPSRGGNSASRKDVVRCILVAPDWGWLTLDEKQALVVTAEGQRVVAEAPPGVTLLCCCFLEERRRFAVGGSKGYLRVVSLNAAAAPPTQVPLGTAAPVLALAAPEWTDQSPYLFASVDGDVLAIDLDDGSVLCSLGERAALRAEALLCARVPLLEPEEEAFPPEPLLLAAGGDAADGTAGRLSLLRARAPCADGEAEGAELVWQAEHELPIFAVALAPSAPATAGEDEGADAEAPPLLLAAASGTVVTLHDASTGAALRRLAAGRDGLLNALAFSPCGHCLLAAGSSEVVYAFHVSTLPLPLPLPLTRTLARWCTPSTCPRARGAPWCASRAPAGAGGSTPPPSTPSPLWARAASSAAGTTRRSPGGSSSPWRRAMRPSSARSRWRSYAASYASWPVDTARRGLSDCGSASRGCDRRRHGRHLLAPTLTPRLQRSLGPSEAPGGALAAAQPGPIR